MRLLDAKALLHDNVARLAEFPDASRAPNYAILSHTWEKEEVLFEDIALGPQHGIVARSIGSSETSRSSTSSEFPYTDSASDFTSTGPDEDVPDSVSENNDCETNDTPSKTVDASDIEVTESHVKAGWNKVLNTCLLTIRDGLNYVWIDTCCIDKSSSAELSEAINSMYKWYQGAVKCYAYLSDRHIPSRVVREAVPVLSLSINYVAESSNLPIYLHRGDPLTRVCVSSERKQEQHEGNALQGYLMGCHWFTRGWTLQELIAPKQLLFYDRHWQLVARRHEILHILEAITGIHKEALEPSLFCRHHQSVLSNFSVAQRMYWASSRRTTRKEDEAYCLLGIFEINMSLLYGEGDNAFRRLQEEIIRKIPDQSILAWSPPPEISFHHLRIRGCELLAWSASCFRGSARHIVSTHMNLDDLGSRSQFQLTHQGLEIELSMDEYRLQAFGTMQVAALSCILQQPGAHSHRVGLLLELPMFHFEKNGTTERLEMEVQFRKGEGSERMDRLPNLPLSWSSRQQSKTKLLLSPYSSFNEPRFETIRIKVDLRPNDGQRCIAWSVLAAFPGMCWSAATLSLRLPGRPNAWGGIAVNSTTHGTIFIILEWTGGADVGVMQKSRMPMGQLFNFWIVKESMSDAKALRTPSTRRRAHRATESLVLGCPLGKYEYYLEKLCSRASTFASKDYFEHSSRRRDSHKSVLLSDCKILTVSLHDNRYSIEGEANISLRIHAYSINRPDYTPGKDFFRMQDMEPPLVRER